MSLLGGWHCWFHTRTNQLAEEMGTREMCTRPAFRAAVAMESGAAVVACSAGNA
jgi:hypothetical protein